MTLQANAQVRLTDPAGVLATLLHHLEEHDLAATMQRPGLAIIRIDESRIEMEAGADALRIAIAAPSANTLFILKEAAVRHVAEIVPDASEAIRWDDDATDCASSANLPPNFHALRLSRRSRPFPGMIRLTLTGQNVAALARDGLHIKLMLPADRQATPLWPHVAANGTTRWPQGPNALHVRYYTIKAIREAQSEVDIDVVEHSGGVISDWAAEADFGETIGVMGPGGGEPPRTDDAILIAGDGTALPAIARMIERLPASARGHVVVALPEHEDAGCYLPPCPLEVHRLSPDDFDAVVVEKAQSLGLHAQVGFAWFAGERDTTQKMRKLFKGEFGLRKGRQYAISYWHRGRLGNAKP